MNNFNLNDFLKKTQGNTSQTNDKQNSSDNGFSIDSDTVNNLQNMLGNTDLSGILSKVPPDMMQNIGNMLGNNNNANASEQKSENDTAVPNLDINDLSSLLNKLNLGGNTTTNSSDNPNNSGFDLSNIDMKTVMKMTSALSKLNTNDSRSSLVKSLKPFLRDSRKNKLDQYSNLLNMTKLADVLKNSQDGGNEGSNND